LDGAKLADEDASLDVYDSSGPPRQLRTEVRTSRERFTAGSPRVVGLFTVFGFLDSPNYGVLRFDAELMRDTERPANSLSTTGGLGRPLPFSFTLSQTGFPLAPNVKVDTQVGALSTPLAALPGLSSRVFVPSFRLFGASTHGLAETARLHSYFALGQPIQYDGLFTAQLQRMPGTVVQGGLRLDGELQLQEGLARQVAKPAWTAAVQAVEASDLAPFGSTSSVWRPLGVPQPQDRFDARSLWAGAGGELGNVQWQLHGLAGQLALRPGGRENAAASGSNARAAWFDVAWRDRTWRLGTGAYQLGSGLHWGGLPMASDIEGSYLRGGWQSRNWSVDGSLDRLRSRFADGFGGYYATAGVRHRWDASTTLAASAALRDYNGRAYSTAIFGQQRHDWGLSELRLEGVQEPQGARNTRTVLLHEWAMEAGYALTTSLSAARALGAASTSSPTAWQAAAAFEWPLGQRASLRGNINLESSGGPLRTGTTLATVWPLGAGWTVESGLNHDRRRAPTVFAIDPLAPPVAASSNTLVNSTFYLSLRRDLQAGSSTSPLGGRARDGGGSIDGVVFFDANKNGRMDASERGVPGVTVVLDGRYSAKTDSQGRYDFAWVAVGGRELQVLNETLPLPLSTPDNERVPVQVTLRETARAHLPVVQP
jgi:hypothetical protein